MVTLSVAQSWRTPRRGRANEPGLGTLFARVLPPSRQEVSSADVVFALVAQRCIAPGSKLSAERWVPTTALPELMGVAPGALHNARIHRVLEALDEASKHLQEELARRRSTASAPCSDQRAPARPMRSCTRSGSPFGSAQLLA